MKQTIAVIMAHADDIELSAGATLARYIDKGYGALYGVLSRCNSGWTITEERGGHYVSSLEIIPKRRQEAEAAAAIFGATLYYGDLLENCYTTREGLRIAPSFTGIVGTDGQSVDAGKIDADDIPQGDLFAVAAGAGGTWDSHPVIEEIVDLLVEWQPELVIGQPFGNLNPDHFMASQIVAVAWQLAARKIDIGPYWIPVMPSGDGYRFPPFRPDHFIDTSGYEQPCLDALACHISQGGHLQQTQARRRAVWAAWKQESGFESADAFLQVYP